jgi:hypothetical protein
MPITISYPQNRCRWTDGHGLIWAARNELRSLKPLLGEKEIDVYSYARLPPIMSKEQIFGDLVTLQKEGWFRAVRCDAR